MINSKNWHILDDLNTSSISSIAKTLNILEYANFSHIANIDNYRYDNTGEIRTGVHRTYVLGPGFIEQTFIEQMFEGNMGGLLPEIMADCKNFFQYKDFLKFTDCKSCFNLFLFFDRVQEPEYSLLTTEL